MPYANVIIPLRGWMTDSPYSGVPEGYSHDLLNMIPSDPFRRRTRLSTRPGFNLMYKFATGGVQCLVRTTAFNGIPPIIKDRVLCVNAGKIYYIDPGGDPVQVLQSGGGSGAALVTSGRVEAVQRGQYCYFVDGTNYRKVDLFASPPVWSAWQHPSHGPEDIILNTVGGTTYTATLIALYGTRIVLAGVKRLENVWWMSQIDDPDHWAATTGQPDEPIAGNDGQWGVPGDEIVSLIPFGQGSIIFAGKQSMSMLTRDPIFGNATIQQMSRTVGVVGPRAWCNGPEKSVYVLAQDGLYRMTPNDFNIDRGQLLSLNRVDAFFNAVKWDDINASLAYDAERRGVWIFLTRTDQPASSTHLFYSEQTDGFFPIRLYDPDFHGAYSTCGMLTSDGRTQVSLFGSTGGMLGYFDQKVVAGVDGYVAAGYDPARNPSSSEALDQQIVSRASIGPIVASQPGLGFCNEVQIELGADDYHPDPDIADDIERPYAELLTADTAQEAIADKVTSVTVSETLGIDADGGTSTTSSFTATYDAGNSGSSPSSYLDGQYSQLIEGAYTTQDTFVAEPSRVYEDESSRYELIRTSITIGGTPATRWVVRFQSDDRPVYVQMQVNNEYAEDPSIGEYRYTVTDETLAVVSVLSTVTVDLAATQFSGLTTTELGNLIEGANNRMRCRVRGNAMYLRISSTGYPVVMERAALNVHPVGPRRTVVDVT